MKMWKCVSTLAILATFAVGHITLAQDLTMEEYLLQVRGSHPGLKGAKEGMHGAEMRLNESSTLFHPKLELSATHEEDEKPYYNTQFNGIKAKSDLYEAAIKQQTPIGLTAKLGYQFLRRDVEGVNTNFAQPTSYTASPMLEVNLPLWRNGFGSEIRATRDKIKAGSQASFYGNRLKFDGIALEAESTYSGLYFARLITIARKNSLDLSKQLLDWMSKRAVNELADDNDLNQARAANEARELEYLKSQNDERRASRAFNSLRGIVSDSVDEKLAFKSNPVDTSKRSSRLMNDQVRVAEKQKEMARADLRLALENHRPIVNVFGKYSYNSLDAQRDEAMSDAWQDDHPYQAVGATVEVPILFWETKRINDGYRRSLAAADLELQRLYQENERDLADLYANIESSQKLVNLSQKLVETQKRKLEKERQRHRRGRTSLFQVLQYEQEYVQTQLAQLGYQAELVGLTNQLRLYRSE
jgi:outer membrane protein TolC